MFYRLMITFFIATLFTANSRAMEELTNPLAQLSNVEARASYCFYAFSINIQLASKGPNRMKVLSLIKPYRAWDNVIKEKFPNKNTRNDELAKAALQFETDVGSGVESNNLSQPVAQQSLIDSISDDCKTEFKKFKNYTPTKNIVQAKQNSQTKKLASTPAKNSKEKKPENYPDSPFHKGVFNPGWKGDISWFDSDIKERLVLMSFDNLPAYSKQWQIHANARMFGSNARKHCVGHLMEFNRSPDGLTLYMKDFEEDGCGGSNRIISINAVAADNIRFEVREKDKVLASGNLKPHSGRDKLVLRKEKNFVVPTDVIVEQVDVVEQLAIQVATPVKTKQAITEISKNAKLHNNSIKATFCEYCLKIEKGTSTNNKTPFYSGIFDQSWNGKFYWDWYEAGTLTVSSQANLIKKSDSTPESLIFQLNYKSKYNGVCVGDLHEIGRSENGYIIHLKAKPELAKSCKPQITHAYILPYPSRNEATVELMMMQLYSEHKLVSGAFIRSHAKRKIVVESLLAKKAKDAINNLRVTIENFSKKKKDKDFKTSAEYPKIAPLYNSCMKYKPKYFGVMNDKPYCQCISEKVGIGGRIPDDTLADYAKDFSRLNKLLHGVEPEENKFYYRFGNTCARCSQGNELKSWCSGADSFLFVASDYKDMIRLLEANSVIIDSTDFYSKNFYRAYLQGYSVLCEEHIIDPVPFVYTVTETTIGGLNSGDTRETIRTTTFVARAYAEKYGRFREETKRKSNVNQTFRGLKDMGTERGLRNIIRDTKQFLKIEKENHQAIGDHLRGQCTSKSVKTAYKRLLTLVN